MVLDADGTEEGDGNQRGLLLLEALAFGRQVKADEFFIAASWSHIRLLTEITDVLRNSPLPVRLLPDQIIRSILDRRAAAYRPSRCWLSKFSGLLLAASNGRSSGCWI